MAELVHAIVIMAFYHSLAGFALGCGLNPEIDTQLGHTTKSESDAATPVSSNPALGYIGMSPSSDSELTDSDVNSPTMSPPSKAVSDSIMQHFFESKGWRMSTERSLVNDIKFFS